jgi:signal peptidase I
MPPLNYTLAPSSNGYALLKDDQYSLIPEGHVFLMGDNSGSSRDARWFGFMPKHHILGRVTSIWWPIGRWRDLTGYTDSPWWYGFWISLAIFIPLRFFYGRSWSTRSDAVSGLISKGEHMFLRFAYRRPKPFDMTVLKLILLPLTFPVLFQRARGRVLKRGDLVVYSSEGISRRREEGILGIVAGVAGDKVFLQQGKLLINDEPVNETLLPMSFPKEGADDKYGRSKGKEFSLVPDGHFYILTQEGSAHEDSRCLGWIGDSDIVGIATRVWWPPTRVRSLRK